MKVNVFNMRMDNLVQYLLSTCFVPTTVSDEVRNE